MSGSVGPGPQGKQAVVNTEYGAEALRQGTESGEGDNPVTTDEVIALDTKQMPAGDPGRTNTKNG